MAYDVVIVVGSKDSDMEKVGASKMLDVLNKVGVSWELSVISAHRNPDELKQYIVKRANTGTLLFVGAAGMAAHLPGAIAAILGGFRPVLGVALSSSVLDGLDALLSEVRMPPGLPVGVCGIDEAGLRNAAIMACQIVALARPQLDTKLYQYLADNNKQPAIGLLASDQELPKREGE